MSAPHPAPRAGYTLPVFACAAAIAALHWLNEETSLSEVSLDLIQPAQTATIEIESVAGLKPGTALAIARSDPGDNLDLTRDTPIWAMVERITEAQTEAIEIVGGEGIGRQQQGQGDAAIYAYAKQLIQTNVSRHLQLGDRVRVTLILPEGRSLAQRTSNAAFGVVDGLSLLGTSGISQPLSAPQQLDQFRVDLRTQASQSDQLVFCIGENGLDLARRFGIPEVCLVKTANWIGPMLVEASLQAVKSVLLLGYHGKLLKLAGGIFHTHHHVADGRQEILTAHGVAVGLPLPDLQQVLRSATAEDALAYLRQLDTFTSQPWDVQVYQSIAAAVERRSREYVYTHSERQMAVGCALFDRDRQIFAVGETGRTLLQSWVPSLRA